MTTPECHELLFRRGYCLPSIKSSIITHDYLHDVDVEKIWCPRFVDIKYRKPYKNPEKKLLFKEVMIEAQKHKLNLGVKDMSKVTVEWLLLILGTLAPDHYFF